ncbi:hypothetical protein VNI00_004923 [Paramarasmius palmivorus]|uniref:Uncharacterized protein n=1 Tax=Paramarasmius palmivorus TaxID=297713 RepID=A0AAW0DI63_9AGAR
MIVPELQRCEELLFHGEWSELARVAPLQLSVTFPHLRSLNVNYSFSAPVPASVRHLFHALKIAPKLETVDITSTISPEDLPCHQLTTVRGSDLEVAQVAHILRSCPNLKNLELDLLLIGPGSPSNVVVHSSLREFRIRANPDWLIDIVNSLARFSFPALQTFTLNMKTSGMILIDPTSGVIEVIRRFSASLRKVVLITGSQSLHRTLCRDILQICPNLHSFAIEVYAYSEDDRDSEYILHLIQSLTIMDVSQAFLAPKLTELCLLEHDSRMSAEYATAFLDMVESRSAGIGVSRLTDAELKSTSAWVAQLSSDASIVERIKQLSRKGIRCALGAI